MPLTACAYLENHVMLLVYGYFVRRHDIRSAIKAVGTTHCVPVCVQLLGRPDDGTVLSMYEHYHHFSHTHTCTLTHSGTPEEGKLQHEPRDILMSI